MHALESGTQPSDMFTKGLEIGEIGAMDYLQKIDAVKVETSEEWLEITNGFTPERPLGQTREELIDYEALRDGILQGSFTVFYQERTQ